MSTITETGVTLEGVLRGVEIYSEYPFEREWWCIGVGLSGKPCRNRAQPPMFASMVGWQPFCLDCLHEFATYIEMLRSESDWRRASGSSVVYVLQSGPALKVGVTTNLPNRLASLDRANDSTKRPDCAKEPVKLIAWMRGTVSDEHALHDQLSDRLEGEWFLDSESNRSTLIDACLAHVDRHRLKVCYGVADPGCTALDKDHLSHVDADISALINRHHPGLFVDGRTP
jgi:hypothetical protein